MINKARIDLAVALACCLVLAQGGCSDGLPPTVAVQGTVTYNGQPLTEGTVMLEPLQVNGDYPRRPAVGELDAQGRYTLATFRQGDGVVPGRYAVLVHSYTSQPTLANPQAPWKWRIPERYGDPQRADGGNRRQRFSAARARFRTYRLNEPPRAALAVPRISAHELFVSGSVAIPCFLGDVRSHRRSQSQEAFARSRTQ